MAHSAVFQLCLLLILLAPPQSFPAPSAAVASINVEGQVAQGQIAAAAASFVEEVHNREERPTAALSGAKRMWELARDIRGPQLVHGIRAGTLDGVMVGVIWGAFGARTRLRGTLPFTLHRVIVAQAFRGPSDSSAPYDSSIIYNS